MTYSSTKKLPLVRHLEKKRKATKIALRLNRLHSIAYIRNVLYGITSFAATETIVGSGKGRKIIIFSARVSGIGAEILADSTTPYSRCQSQPTQ